jgi:hypothetical protein
MSLTQIPTTETPATHLHQPDLAPDTQATFCATLAQWGNVRAAAQQVGVSRAHLYRMRRASPAFRDLWDAALVLARPQVEEVLADRALNGVQEVVFYHGEEVATRTRHDARLLLAHLGRLDRLASTTNVTRAAEDFDAQLEKLRNPPQLVDWDDDPSDWYDYGDRTTDCWGYPVGNHDEDEGDDYADEDDHAENDCDRDQAEADADDGADAGDAADADAGEETNLAETGEGDCGGDGESDSLADPDADDDSAAREDAAIEAALLAPFDDRPTPRPDAGLNGPGFSPLDSFSCVSNSGPSIRTFGPY